jgi:hypothetical protein
MVDRGRVVAGGRPILFDRAEVRQHCGRGGQVAERLAVIRETFPDGAQSAVDGFGGRAVAPGQRELVDEFVAGLAQRIPDGVVRLVQRAELAERRKRLFKAPLGVQRFDALLEGLRALRQLRHRRSPFGDSIVG